METSKNGSNFETDSKYIIQMALEHKFSWSTLALMLDEMTPTLKHSKQLVKVLLEELQNLQDKYQNLVHQNDKSFINDEEHESVNWKSSADKFESYSNEDIIKTQFEEETQDTLEGDDEIEATDVDEKTSVTENLDQFYTFVGSRVEESIEKKEDCKAIPIEGLEKEENLDLGNDMQGQNYKSGNRISCKFCMKSFSSLAEEA